MAPRVSEPTVALQDLLPWPDRHAGYSGYLGLLFFAVVIITYYLPGADIAAAAAVGSVIIGLSLGSLHLRWRLEATALVVLLGLDALSLRDSLDPVWAAQRTTEFAKITLVFLASVHVLSTGRRVAAFATAWFGLFMLFPVRGALFNYARGYRLLGRALWNYVWSNPNDLAAGALLTAAIGGALLYVFRRGPARLGVLAGLTLIGVVILLTGSRGVFVGSAGAALILVWRSQHKVKALVTIGACLLVIVAAAPQDIRDRLWTLGQLDDPNAIRSYDQGSAKERLQVWKSAFAIIRDHPVLGVGVGAFPKANEDYAKEVAEGGAIFGRAGAPREDAHSTYLTVWTELGTVGLLAYCTLLGATWHRLRSVRQRWGRVAPWACAPLGVLEAGLVGYTLACLWATYTVLTLPYLFLAVISSWATTVDDWARDRESTKRLAAAAIGRGRTP